MKGPREIDIDAGCRLHLLERVVIRGEKLAQMKVFSLQEQFLLRSQQCQADSMVTQGFLDSSRLFLDGFEATFQSMFDSILRLERSIPCSIPSKSGQMRMVSNSPLRRSGSSQGRPWPLPQPASLEHRRVARAPRQDRYPKAGNVSCATDLSPKSIRARGSPAAL